MTFNWGKKFTELQEKQGKLGTQKSLISRSFIAHAIDQAKAEQREEDKKIIEWATGSDTGMSSGALCRFMLDIPSTRYDSPSDEGDRGRCIRLLNKVPEWWDRLDEMAALPSHDVTVFSKNGIEVRHDGWKEQIPLIKKEATAIRQEGK